MGSFDRHRAAVTHRRPSRPGELRLEHRVAGEVSRPRLPQNVTCRFSALRSSEVGSQRSRCYPFESVTEGWKSHLCGRPIRLPQNGRQARGSPFMGCATLKLAKRPAGLPIILESATQLTTAEGDDGISTAHRPEHSGPLQPPQHSFASCLDDSRAHE